MIKINKKVEYALMALKWMAHKEKGSLTSVQEICKALKTPFDTTAKVLQTMKHQKILGGRKGIKGGYTLAKSLREITFIELAHLIENKDSPSSFCTTPKGLCGLHHSCNIITPIEQLNQRVNQFLTALNLEELLMETDHHES